MVFHHAIYYCLWLFFVRRACLQHCQPGQSYILVILKTPKQPQPSKLMRDRSRTDCLWMEREDNCSLLAVRDVGRAPEYAVIRQVTYIHREDMYSCRKGGHSLCTQVRWPGGWVCCRTYSGKVFTMNSGHQDSTTKQWFWGFLRLGWSICTQHIATDVVYSFGKATSGQKIGKVAQFPPMKKEDVQSISTKTREYHVICTETFLVMLCFGQSDKKPTHTVSRRSRRVVEAGNCSS